MCHVETPKERRKKGRVKVAISTRPNLPVIKSKMATTTVRTQIKQAAFTRPKYACRLKKSMDIKPTLGGVSVGVLSFWRGRGGGGDVAWFFKSLRYFKPKNTIFHNHNLNNRTFNLQIQNRVNIFQTPYIYEYNCKFLAKQNSTLTVNIYFNFCQF